MSSCWSGHGGKICSRCTTAPPALARPRRLQTCGVCVSAQATNNERARNNHTSEQVDHRARPKLGGILRSAVSVFGVVLAALAEHQHAHARTHARMHTHTHMHDALQGSWSGAFSQNSACYHCCCRRCCCCCAESTTIERKVVEVLRLFASKEPAHQWCR